MARIKQLSAHEAQKIAAGEVVERPANVVKELVENAIDAGGTAISIYIENAGKKLIRIVDNGSGMDKDDAHMAIKHHATSKISSVNDLTRITTFGFRGEALSSISAVSKMTLVTKEEVGTAGIALTIYDSVVQKETVIAANRGTDISVQELFYNVPVRQKFLKTKETEWRAIVQLFHAFCFSYPHINFKLYHENKLVYNCPADKDILARIRQLFDESLARNMLTFEHHQERMQVSISGAITNSHYTKYDRNHIFLFVNNRWIKNHKLVNAFIRGYKNIFQPNTYPAGCIFITLDPEYVDINIHPRKEEVQFLHPKLIEEALVQAVSDRLDAHATQKLGAQTQTTPVQQVPSSPFSHIPYAAPSFNRTPSSGSIASKPSAEESFTFKEILNEEFSTIISEKSNSTSTAPTQEISDVQITLEQQAIVQADISRVAPSYTLLGQALQTYIMIETADGITMIDQHAAHERIMYESFKKNFTSIISTPLLFPELITLNKEDIAALSIHLSLFEPLGLLIEPISATQLMIKSTPVFLKNQSIEDILTEMLICIHQERVNNEKLRLLLQEKIHAQMSCKAAVKAGDIISQESMHEIVTGLFACPNKTTCPHGRPTLWQITEHEIKKKFKRDYRSA